MGLLRQCMGRAEPWNDDSRQRTGMSGGTDRSGVGNG